MYVMQSKLLKQYFITGSTMLIAPFKGMTPGSTLAVDCGVFTHYSIISDQLGPDGMPRLISASKRTGTVKEETWSDVISNEKIKILPLIGTLTAEEILSKARSRIGNWVYSVLNFNCEHFVNWCNNLPFTSKQITTSASLASMGAIIGYNMPKEHKVVGTIVGIAVGVLLGLKGTKP
jgi:hypothetical protein